MGAVGAAVPGAAPLAGDADAVAAAAVAAVAADHPPLPTVASVDLSRYLGRWYEIALLPNRFERQCVAEFRHRVVAVERRGKAVHGRDRYIINIGFGLADPVFQFFEILRHSGCSCMNDLFARRAEA